MNPRFVATIKFGSVPVEIHCHDEGQWVLLSTDKWMGQLMMCDWFQQIRRVYTEARNDAVMKTGLKVLRATVVLRPSDNDEKLLGMITVVVGPKDVEMMVFPAMPMSFSMWWKAE